MLKEAGLFERALRCYEQAQTLRPVDPEPALQSGLLSKIVGDFEAASKFFLDAKRLGYAPVEFLNAEFTILRKTSRPSSLAAIRRQGDVRIYLSSSATLVSESDPQHLKSFIGRANYSYAYILSGFQTALEAAGYHCEVIKNPEYVPDIRPVSAAPVNIHLGFYPPDGPRFLKGAYNVLCMAWEFERLKTELETLSYHSFADPAKMMSRANEIWSISNYGTEAMKRSGVQNVKTVPTPILAGAKLGRTSHPGFGDIQEFALKLDRISWRPLAIWPVMQGAMNEQSINRADTLLGHFADLDDESPPVIFISIFNVHDFRKQIKPMVEAFADFSRSNPKSYLLLKVSCLDSEILDIAYSLLGAQISDDGAMTPPLVSEKILLTTEVLSREQMNCLYDMASFYICTSHAEGQNLPILESMGRGVVPVSVNHTAMEEYIRADNAVVIPSSYRPMGPKMTARYGLYGIGTYYVNSHEVLAALRVAVGLADEQYSNLSSQAVQTVERQFGADPFCASVKSLVERVAALTPGERS